MRKQIFILIALLVLLYGCSSENVKDSGELIREKYETIEKCTMTVDIQADYGDRISVYTVTYNQEKKDTGSITIVKPNEIAGVTASFQEGSSTLQYDGLILETGKLSNTAMTPVDAVPTLFKTWRSGYLTESGQEKWNNIDCFHLTYSTNIENSEIVWHTWFEIDTLKPVHAETLINDQLVITCDFKDVTW